MMKDRLMSDVVPDTQDVLYSLIASPSFATDGVCYAAYQSGLRVSDDGGGTWRSAFESLGALAPLSATAVAVSPCYHADRRVFVGIPGGILTSTDGGTQWNLSSLPTPAPFITTLAISPDYDDDGVVLAGSLHDGAFVTEDRGTQWAAWNFGLLDTSVFCVALSPDFRNDRGVYAGTETGLYYSKNRGRSWRELPFPNDCASVISLALSPAYAQDGKVWAGTDANGLFYSDDYGESWQWAGLMGSVSTIIVTPSYPVQPDLLAMVDDTLYISRDGGQHWHALAASAGLPASIRTVTAPISLDVSARLLIGSDEGIVSTTIIS